MNPRMVPYPSALPPHTPTCGDRSWDVGENPFPKPPACQPPRTAVPSTSSCGASGGAGGWGTTTAHIHNHNRGLTSRGAVFIRFTSLWPDSLRRRERCLDSDLGRSPSPFLGRMSSPNQRWYRIAATSAARGGRRRTTPPGMDGQWDGLRFPAAVPERAELQPHDQSHSRRASRFSPSGPAACRRKLISQAVALQQHPPTHVGRAPVRAVLRTRFIAGEVAPGNPGVSACQTNRRPRRRAPYCCAGPWHERLPGCRMTRHVVRGVGQVVEPRLFTQLRLPTRVLGKKRKEFVAVQSTCEPTTHRGA
jgi:hypothetical protein